MRYAKLVARLSVGKTLNIWIVVRADEGVAEMDARGWEAVPGYLSDEEVMERFGVKRIVPVAGVSAGRLLVS